MVNTNNPIIFRGIIYKAECLINKKLYFGQTINSLKNRIKNHEKNSKKKKHTTIKFLNAIKKYGINNFKWEIVEKYNFNNKEELIKVLNERESFYIRKYNTIIEGYNIRPGGNNSFLSERTKKILKENILGKTFEELYGKEKANKMKLNISLALKNKLKSKSHKNKIRKAHKGMINTKESNEKNKISNQNSTRYTCSHCGISTNGGNYNRWHGNKCKKQIINIV
jgi:group I intron endonuclease